MSEQIGFFSDNNNDEVVVEIFQINVILYAQKKHIKWCLKYAIIKGNLMKIFKGSEFMRFFGIKKK